MIGIIRSPAAIVYQTDSRNKKDLWLVHGLCESSQSFEKIFQSPLADTFNIYIIDMPGFGLTPYQEKYADMTDLGSLLADCIQKYSVVEGHEIYVAGHSMGAIPAILACERLSPHISLMINIEGTIAETPTRGSYRVDEFTSEEDFKKFIAGNFRAVVRQSLNNPKVLGLFSRYLRNIEASDPRALMSWCKGAKHWTSGDMMGHKYLELGCKTLFVYGSESFLKPEIEFARKHGCEMLEIPKANHWMMLEKPDTFYAELGRYLHSEPVVTSRPR